MSTNLLDTILENAGNDGARIVSEQHNLKAINWVAGVTDPGEMIACGYRPELRRNAGESDEVYLERITPLLLALPIEEQEAIMGAALKRASLAVTNGKVSLVVAGESAWHKLGVQVDKAFTSSQAIEWASANWKVVKLPMSFTFNGKTTETDDTYALIREDTGTKLATVGSRYQVVQNVDTFEFLDKVRGEFGAHYHTAGVLHDGKKLWIQARFPAQAFEVQPGDEVIPYITVMNSHGGEALTVFPTEERAVCDNTLRIAHRVRNKDKTLSIRHTGNLQAKVQEAQKVLGIAVKGFDDFKAQAQVLVRTPLDVRKYGGQLLDTVLGVTETQQNLEENPLGAILDRVEEEEKLNRLLDRRDNLLEDMLERAASGRCEPQGTAWSALNAATELADHGDYYSPRGDEREVASKRLENRISGKGDELKQEALSLALAAAK